MERTVQNKGFSFICQKKKERPNFVADEVW